MKLGAGGLILALALLPGMTESAPAQDTDLVRLSGREIYARVLANRFDAFRQTARLVSGDRGGNVQQSQFEMWYRSFGAADAPPGEDPVLSKALLRYTAPFDLRHSGYLVIRNRDRADDQFVYRASSRRVTRIQLRGEAVFGSDFSFEDVIPRELEDATYARLPDRTYQGVDCFAIEARPRTETGSEYSRFEILIDIARSVPLHTRYWDDHEIEVKLLESDPASVVRIEDVWVPMRSRMTSLRQDSYSELEILDIVPSLDPERARFDLRRLTASH
jgi:hypothetical protein